MGIKLVLSFQPFANFISERVLHEVTIFEKLFIVFALAFVLAEYTATRENGWRSMFPYFKETFFFMLFILVYMANVMLLRAPIIKSNSFSHCSCGMFST